MLISKKKKYSRKRSQQVLIRSDLVTPSQRQGHWKWYKMVEVNGAYKRDSYKQLRSKSLFVMFNIKVFATKDCWPGDHLIGRTQLTQLIGRTDRFVTNMGENQETKRPYKNDNNNTSITTTINNNKEGANTQTIHNCITYRTFMMPSPFHCQQSQRFGLLHATLQENNCTGSNFP